MSHAGGLFVFEVIALVALFLAIGGAIVEHNEAAGRAFDRLGRWLFDGR